MPENILMKRHISTVIVFTTLLAIPLIGPRPVLANTEKNTSVLTGVVLGPNDKPVARAAITYQSSAGRSPHVVHTDAHGRFAIAKLPADNYDLRASAKGIFSEWEKNVTIHRGEIRNITLRLIYARKMPKEAIAAGNVR
jgi:hypothetical protein